MYRSQNGGCHATGAGARERAFISSGQCGVCGVQRRRHADTGDSRGPLATDQGLHCGNSGGTLAIWCTVGTVAVVITLHGGNICTLCTVARDNGANCGAARGSSVAPVEGCGHLSSETDKYRHRYILVYSITF